MDKIDFRHVSLHFYFLKTLTLTLKLGRRRQPFWENMNLHVCSVKDMLLLLKCVPYEQRSSQSTVAYCRAMCHWPGRYEGSQVRLACHYGSIQGCIFGTHLRYVLNASIQQQQYWILHYLLCRKHTFIIETANCVFLCVCFNQGWEFDHRFFDPFDHFLWSKDGIPNPGFNCA